MGNRDLRPGDLVEFSLFGGGTALGVVERVGRAADGSPDFDAVAADGSGARWKHYGAGSVLSVERRSPTPARLARAVALDVEATGLGDADEPLSVAVVDAETGEALLDTLVRPERARSWEGAAAVHGIAPADVEAAPLPSEVAPAVVALLGAAETVVGYDVWFDLDVACRCLGAAPGPGAEVVDVMELYAALCGEPRPLSECAERYGIPLEPHVALEDARAAAEAWPLVEADLAQAVRREADEGPDGGGWEDEGRP